MNSLNCLANDTIKYKKGFKIKMGGGAGRLRKELKENYLASLDIHPTIGVPI